MHTVIFLASRTDDTALEMKQVAGPLEKIVRSARERVESFALSEFHSKSAPAGFLVENEEGFEVHRWYAPAPEKRSEAPSPTPASLRLAPRRSYL